ncbi:MAG: phosphatidate cytidylyltransferase [Clostridia bacterium]|nr:phosphatidate cytidylyltransferase [Clostridia bacterium]
MKILKRTVQGFFFFGLLMGFIILTGTIKRENIYYGQYFFDALLLIVTVISLFEMISAVKEAGYKPIQIPLFIALILAYPAVKFLGYQGIMLLIAIAIFLLFLFYIFDSSTKFNDFLISIFVFIYPLLPLIVGMQLINQFGMIPILTAIGAAMMADVFAFYFGSLIKGPKIFPKISPNKTYSGSFIGLIGGALGALVVYALFELTNIPLNRIVVFKDIFNPWLFYPVIGIAIGFLGEIGDLAASRIKRCTGIKDFGKIMGSHGGITDRLDSIFFAVIFMAIFMSFLGK